MKRFACYALAATFAVFSLTSSAIAAPGKAKPNKGKPVAFKIVLAPDPALIDLAAAKSRIDFQNKVHRSLKGVLSIPLVAPSLGIADAVGAAAALIHLEFTRAGVVVADCSMAYQADSDASEPSTVSRYRLHVKTNGKHEVKGSCGNNSVPTLQKDDSVKAYAIVAGVRVDFMSH